MLRFPLFKYWGRGVFLGMMPKQIPISEFEVRHNSRVCVWYFQVCKFHFCLLAKYFISVNSGSCSPEIKQLHPDCSWGETDPLLWLSFSTWAALEHLMDFCAGTPLWATYTFASTSCSCMVKLVSASFKRPRRIWTGVFFMFLDFPLEKRSHNWSRRHRNRNPVGSNSGCPTCFLVKLIGNGLETKNTH